MAGDSLRQRLRALAGRAEERLFAAQVQSFLAAAALGQGTESDEAVRRKALAELRHARKEGLLAAPLDAEPLARHGRLESLIDSQEQALADLADTLRGQGYEYLARVLATRPPGGEPLLVLALGYFFRRAVEGDEALFRALSLERQGTMQAASEAGFAALELAMEADAARLEGMLGSVEAAIDDVRELVASQSEQLRAVGEAVRELLDRHRLGRRELRAGDTRTVRDDEDLIAVRSAVARYRALPEAERQGTALLNGVGKLEAIAGDLDAAERDFAAASALARDAAGRAEARFNAFRAALEKRDQQGAFVHFQAAMQDDPARFAPFPLEVYQPEAVLGSGGFGVAFRCRHAFLQAPVVVKSLWLGLHAPDADAVFREARLLRQLDHPNARARDGVRLR